jgi:hypothetical protein
MRPEASALQFFSIDHNSGALATVGSVPGPAPTLGLTAVNNQFLYPRIPHKRNWTASRSIKLPVR